MAVHTFASTWNWETDTDTYESGIPGIERLHFTRSWPPFSIAFLGRNQFCPKGLQGQNKNHEGAYMAENTGEADMALTLGGTGFTMNAMALIAPGAFLWLTFAPQAVEGATAPSMWIGILFALLLCLATAVCYAEMAKVHPGTGSSYYFAEQSFLNHDKAWKYARLMKFIVGWGSHLYYWIYPGVMVGVTGIFCGYVVGTLWPNSMSASNPGPIFMGLVAVVFSFGVAYIAHRGVNGSTGVNIPSNVIQISALLIFSVMALGYRMNHP